ncbi:MAG: flagellar hook-associated protein FlgK [Planctomycetaceae bacterium]
MGLNAALGMASRSLEVFTAGIQVAGQNVSNANTPGYIRETLNLEANTPFLKGNLVFGTGVLADGVVQEIDKFLEVRLHAANTEFGASSAQNAIYKQLEAEIRELGDSDLSTSLSNFLATLNDVANQPESAGLRQIAVQEGQQFAADIASLRSRLDELRVTQTVTIDSLVKEANELIRKIDTLNPQIARLESSGLIKSEAGALRTQRYAALNRLSEIIPIRFRERKDGGVDVFTDNDYLILSGTFQQLETFPTVDRNVQVQSVRLSTTKSELSQNATGGELRGIVDGRDIVLGGFIDSLDTFASNLIFEFNKIHSSGQGLAAFTSVTSEHAAFDATTTLNAAATALPFTPTHGSFQLKVTNTISGLTETSTISIDLDGIGTDTTLNSLAADLTAVNNITATVTANGRLQISSASNYEFQFAEDTSGVLASLGINTFFSGRGSTDIGVNSTLSSDPRFLATARGGGPGDSSNILQLAEFHRQSLSALNGSTLDEFYQTTISSVSQASSSQTTLSDGFRTFRDSLKSQREQFSGVSIDEETVKVLEFQKSFQAAARLISTIDELFTVLLTM